MDIEENIEILNATSADHNIKIQKMQQDCEDLMKETQNERNASFFENLNEITNSWTYIMQLQSNLFNKIQQQQLLKSVEIVGLSEDYIRDNEDVARILTKLLHIQVNTSYVTGFERIANPETFDDNTGADCSPRTLVVHLVDQNIKRRILTVAEYMVLNIPGNDRPIFITEHLTPKNRDLLKKARTAAHLNHYNYVWVNEGKIFVRRGNTSLIYEINDEEDIKNMANN